MRDLTPAELRLVKKAVRDAYAKGRAAERRKIDVYLARMRALKELNGSAGLVLKAWDESKHPRGKNGHFISKDRIEAAKSDPKLAKELRKEVKPEDAGKLDAALGGGGKATSGGGSFAAAWAGRGSKQYREAAAAHEAAKTELAAAAADLSSPAVPYAVAAARHGAAVAAARAAAEKAGAEARLDLRAVLSEGGGNDVPSDTAAGTKWTPAERQRMQDAHDFLRDLLSKSLGPVPRVWYTRPAGARAYWSGVYIAVGRNDDAATYVHEIGHHLENNVPGVREKATEFIRRRCGDEEPVGLAEKFPGHGFGPEERGRADDFGKLFDNPASAYYVGKVYRGGDTEVISMGLELMFRDAKRFARTDPEYFDFIVSVLQPDRKAVAS